MNMQELQGKAASSTSYMMMMLVAPTRLRLLLDMDVVWAGDPKSCGKTLSWPPNSGRCPCPERASRSLEPASQCSAVQCSVCRHHPATTAATAALPCNENSFATLAAYSTVL